MSQFTKNAIVQSFIEILNQKPFDKITVTDIVDRCGINRNTFYYYYQDIYALLDEIFQNETKNIIDKYGSYSSWQEGFIAATKFAFENKRAIYHVYNSIRRELLENYLYNVTRNNMTQFVKEQATGLDVSDDDIKLISDFYTFALVGSVFEWLNDDMKEDPVEFITKAGQLFEGNIRYTLEKNCKRQEPLNTVK